MHQQASPPPPPPAAAPSITSRPKPSLLIPTKRPLLPPHSTNPTTPKQTPTQTATPTKIHKILNPSSVPAGIQFRRPAFSSIGDLDGESGRGKEKQQQQQQQQWDVNDDRKANTNANTKTKTDTKTEILIEVDFSCPPQPFLDVDVWERWDVRRKEKEAEKDVEVEEMEDENEKEKSAAIRSASYGGAHVVRGHGQDGQLGTEHGSMAVKTRRRVGRAGSRSRSRRRGD